MSPSEIRQELLRQHAEIRLSAVEVKDAAAARGYLALNELRVCTLRLADKVGRHNRQEGELLQGLRTVDAWDSVRADFMSEQHAAEHQHLWVKRVEHVKADPVVIRKSARDRLHRFFLEQFKA